MHLALRLFNWVILLEREANTVLKSPGGRGFAAAPALCERVYVCQREREEERKSKSAKRTPPNGEMMVVRVTVGSFIFKQWPIQTF